MPTYDYKCKKCGREFEVYLQRWDDSPGRCIDCDSLQLEQVLISSPRIAREYRPYSYLDRGEPTPKISVRVPSNYKGKKANGKR